MYWVEKMKSSQEEGVEELRMDWGVLSSVDLLHWFLLDHLTCYCHSKLIKDPLETIFRHLLFLLPSWLLSSLEVYGNPSAFLPYLTFRKTCFEVGGGINGFFLNAEISNTLLHKLCSMGQQYLAAWTSSGSLFEMQNLSPHPDLLNRNLHFKISMGFTCTLIFEKFWFNIFSLHSCGVSSTPCASAIS